MRETTTIGDALKSYLKDSGLETLLKNQDVIRAWQKVTGPEIAAQTRIVGLKRGTLVVEVASSALYAELNTYYLKDLAASIREEMKNRKIRKIKLCLGQRLGEAGDDTGRKKSQSQKPAKKTENGDGKQG